MWAKFQVVTHVNVDIASLHATSVAETVYDGRKQQGRTEESETVILTDGVLAATWNERYCGNWRSPRLPMKKSHRRGPPYNRDREMGEKETG